MHATSLMAARLVPCIEAREQASSQPLPQVVPPAAKACRPRPIWIAHSSAAMAEKVAERLRGLDCDVHFWSIDSPQSGSQADQVVANPAGFHFLAGAHDHRLLKPDGGTLWRGGLAPGVLRRVKSHIEESLAERIDLDDLARIAGLSRCHFSRAFKESVGVPPHRYIVSRRIVVAAGLIQLTNRPLADIALSVGFADQSHFTRSFVRALGETPRSYRYRHR
jgi:AraC-like DNA-binding protein